MSFSTPLYLSRRFDSFAHLEEKGGPLKETCVAWTKRMLWDWLDGCSWMFLLSQPCSYDASQHFWLFIGIPGFIPLQQYTEKSTPLTDKKNQSSSLQYYTICKHFRDGSWDFSLGDFSPAKKCQQKNHQPKPLMSKWLEPALPGECLEGWQHHGECSRLGILANGRFRLGFLGLRTCKVLVVTSDDCMLGRGEANWSNWQLKEFSLLDLSLGFSQPKWSNAPKCFWKQAKRRTSPWTNSMCFCEDVTWLREASMAKF